MSNSVPVQTATLLPNTSYLGDENGALPGALPCAASIQNSRSSNTSSDFLTHGENIENYFLSLGAAPLPGQTTQRNITLPVLDENSVTSFPVNKLSARSNKAVQSYIHLGKNNIDRHRLYLNRTLLHKNSTENFDRRTTPQGQVYFVNRVTGQSTWYDPTLPKETIIYNQDMNKLPEGWEVRYTANGRQYFVDHNTKTTQFARKFNFL